VIRLPEDNLWNDFPCWELVFPRTRFAEIAAIFVAILKPIRTASEVRASLRHSGTAMPGVVAGRPGFFQWQGCPHRWPSLFFG